MIGGPNDGAAGTEGAAWPFALTIYVDATWATGIQPGDDPDGAGPATRFGYDAFATISDAVDAANAADPGTTIMVNPGTYFESSSLTVTQEDVLLLGSATPTRHRSTSRRPGRRFRSTPRAWWSTASISSATAPGTAPWTAGRPSTRSAPSFASGADVTGALVVNNRISGGKWDLLRRRRIAALPRATRLLEQRALSQRGRRGHRQRLERRDRGEQHSRQRPVEQRRGVRRPRPRCWSPTTSPTVRRATRSLGNTITDSGNHGIERPCRRDADHGNTISNSGLSYPAFRESAGIEVEGKRLRVRRRQHRDHEQHDHRQRLRRDQARRLRRQHDDRRQHDQRHRTAALNGGPSSADRTRAAPRS